MGWGWRINFVFLVGQDIVKYWDFLSKIPGNGHERLVPKTIWHDHWENFVKVSFLDRLVCIADFVWLTLLAPVFLLPQQNCFLRVCISTLLAYVLKFFLPLSTSPISGALNSHKSTSTRFAARTVYLQTNGIEVLPLTCSSTPNLRPRCRPGPLQNWISTSFEATNFSRLLG